VHLARRLEHPASQQFYVAPFRDVRPHSQHRSARGFQFRLCLGEMGFVDVGEDDFHALTNTPFGDPASDAARRTGNHRDFAFKLFHGALAWIWRFTSIP